MVGREDASEDPEAAAIGIVIHFYCLGLEAGGGDLYLVICFVATL